MKPWQRQLLTHGGIVLGFLVLMIGYFNPIVFDGKVIQQGDIIHFQGMAKETQDFRKETGEEALWVSTLFSGMPAFQTSVHFPNNLFGYIDQFFTFGLPRPVNYLFLTFIGFYFLLLTLRVNPYLSGLGALAFALSSYFFIIQSAGHTSKANAIAYMAPVLAGILMTYRGKILLGSALTAFFLALEIHANHYQMTYYLAMAILLLGIFFGIDAIRNNTLPHFAKASGMLLLAAVLGVAPNAGRLLTTAEYAAETMRGSSELQEARGEGEAKNGLNKDYALRWSYGVAETFTFLIPNFHGGASYGDVGQHETYDLLRQQVNAGQAKNIVKNWVTYWGDQPNTAGPVYVGAIVCFLFVLGLMWVPGRLKWWLLAITLMSVMLAWGSNFLLLTDLFFEYFPAYNKFRAPSMFLVIAELSMPLLGILALHQLFKEKEGKASAQRMKQLYIAAGATGGLALLLAALGPSLFDFTRPADTQTLSSMLGLEPNSPQFNAFLDATIADRATIFRNDALRSALFIALAAGLLWLYVKDRLGQSLLIGGLAALVIIDMLPVNRRYLNENNFVSEGQYQRNFAPTPADKAILQDTDPNYRVFNITAGNPYSDAATSYFHKSIGGYHAAKLRRYDDLITNHIEPERSEFIGILRAQLQPSDSAFRARMQDLQVLNMLNTRYLIYNQEAPPLRNPAAMGNAWFVEEVQMVDNADEEITALDAFDPAQTAIVDQRFADRLEGFRAGADPSASIRLIDWQPNHLTYESTTSRDMLAVFSEVYYNDGKGWNAYVDGQKVEHLRANYILRAMVVPAGSHTIEFKFEPASYYQGETISLIASILLLLAVGAALYLEFRPGKSTASPQKEA